MTVFGDFRSQECIAILKKADIVVTNPPFSLFSKYVALLSEYDKKFIIIGHQNAITYKEVFPLIKENRMWLGYGFKRNMAHFIAPHYQDTTSDADHREGIIRVSGVVWYTSLDYKLTVYQCQGTDSEKLDWFRTINIAGEKLTDQELRNAVYAGSWTAVAKRYFSKTQCAAWQLANKYMIGSPIRQDYLETSISWMNEGEIEGYMAEHQHDKNANPLWLYFQAVISWVKATFPKYRKEMKDIAWRTLYNAHKDDNLDPATLDAETTRLMADDEVTKKKGAYERSI